MQCSFLRKSKDITTSPRWVNALNTTREAASIVIVFTVAKGASNNSHKRETVSCSKLSVLPKVKALAEFTSTLPMIAAQIGEVLFSSGMKEILAC